MAKKSNLSNRLKSNNILIKLLLLYLGTAVISVVLLTSILTYMVKKESVKDISSMSSLALSNISNLSTNIFETTGKITYQIFNNTNIKQIILTAGEHNEDKLYASQFVNDFVVANPYILSVYVINSNSVLFKSSQSISIEETHSSIYSVIKNNPQLTPIPRQVRDSSGKIQNIYSFFYHSGTNNSPIENVVMVNISADYLHKYIYTYNTDKKQDIIIANNEGKVLLHNNMEYFAQSIYDSEYYKKIIGSASSSGSFSFTSDINNNICTYTYNGKTMVISISDTKSFFSEANGFQNTIFLICAIILIIIFVASMLISYKVYTPINNVFLNIQSLFNSSTLNEKQMSEFKFISHAFSSIIAKINDYENSSKSAYLLQRNENAKIILTSGSSYDANTLDNIIKFGILGNIEDDYIIAVLRINNYKKFIQINSRDAINFQLNSIGGVAVESLQPHICCTPVDIYPDQVALIIYPSEQYQANFSETTVISCLKNCQIAVSQLLLLDICIGISKASKGVKNLHISYIEAFEYTNYRLIYGQNTILTSNIIVSQDSKSEKLGNLIECTLNSVKSNSLDKFKGYIHDIFILLQRASYEKIINVYFQLANSLLSIPMELETTQKFTFEYDMEEIYEKLKSFECYDDLIEWFTQIFNKTTEIITEKKSLKTPDLLDNIIEFISQNYADNCLSANYMAEKLGITPQYFSRLFNEKFGVSFPEYVNNYRLQLAKDMLLTNDKLSTSKIATLVGYNNSTYFTASFTKKYGISPGKFRTNNKQEEFGI